MEVIITNWGLQSYLSLKRRGVFTLQDYRGTIRPDCELLKTFTFSGQNHPKFKSSQFWGPAKFRGKGIQGGYKMKWHNLGPGQVQLRLCVAIVKSKTSPNHQAFLCTSYVKDDKTEKVEMAKFKRHIRKILDESYASRGKL